MRVTSGGPGARTSSVRRRVLDAHDGGARLECPPGASRLLVQGKPLARTCACSCHVCPQPLQQRESGPCVWPWLRAQQRQHMEVAGCWIGGPRPQPSAGDSASVCLPCARVLTTLAHAFRGRCSEFVMRGWCDAKREHSVQFVVWASARVPTRPGPQTHRPPLREYHSVSAAPQHSPSSAQVVEEAVHRGQQEPNDDVPHR